MTSELDEVCQSIIANLTIENSKNLTQIQLAIGAATTKTVKSHLPHLTKADLVTVEKEKRGLNEYYRIRLTEKGENVKQQDSKKK